MGRHMKTYMMRCRPRVVLSSILAFWLSCLGHGPAAPTATKGKATAAAIEVAGGQPARAPRTVRVDPLAGGGATKVAGLLALEEELHRAMVELGKQETPPYYLGYEVHDRREISVAASEGALTSSDDQRTRVLTTDVRVGDHKLDSTHALHDVYDYGGVAGGSAMLPLTDEPLSMRAVAWAETDKRYKAALERLLKIKSGKQLKTAEEDPSDDFSREKPTVFVEPPAAVTVDVPAWEARARLLSARFHRLPEPHQSQISLEVSAVNRWLTNSEGSSIQTGRSYARLSIHASLRAEDGMELERHESFDAAELAGLPNDATVEKAIDTVIEDLQALARAPLAEPYVGPAIFEGKAAAVFFHEIFGHRIEGHRQKGDEEGQTFTKKVGEVVLPPFISVYDDPTLVRVGQDDLNGFYRFDDEAVAARRVSLVEAGVLKGFLMGRSPVRGFSQSNGHGRRQAGRGAVARQGNLMVEPALAVPGEELRQRLREEARRQGKPFGLLFKDVSGGFTNTSRMAPQAFKVLPILVYRVWADGRPDELMRGADVVGTPLASLNKILAAGDDYRTFNGFCGAESGSVAVSATSPSLLVQQIEIERKEKGDEKPPVLPAPARVASATGADDGVIRRALQDELDRTRSDLHLDQQPRPYFTAYTVSDNDILMVNASLGAVVNQFHNRSRSLYSDVRVGDYRFDNSNYGGSGSRGSLPLDDDYWAARRVLWLGADQAYKRAVDSLARKKAAIAAQTEDESDKVPDFAEQPSAQTISLPSLRAPEPEPLAALATRLSAIFASYPHITLSQVGAMQGVGRQRYLSSEGTWDDERDGFVYLDVSAATQAADGMWLRSDRVFTARAMNTLDDQAAVLERDVRGLADELTRTTKAAIPEGGDALVLFDGPAAAQIVRSLLADRLVGKPQSKVGRSYSTADDLTGKLGQRVVAALLSAYDDPRQEVGPGKQYLLGTYHADDEGVPAQKVSLIKGGVLESLLMSRTPTKELRHSNGHGRGNTWGGARGHIGNLFITARGGLSRAALLARLASEARTRHCDAYVVRLLDDPSSSGSFGRSPARGPGSVYPLVAYQLKDGKEVPVRGFTVEGVLPKTLKDVVAAGNEPFVMNFIDGWRGMGIPSSIISPALLFTRLEVRKVTDRNPRLPLYPHPITVIGKPAPATTSSVTRQGP